MGGEGKVEKDRGRGREGRGEEGRKGRVEGRVLPIFKTNRRL